MNSEVRGHPEYRILQTDLSILQTSFTALHQSYVAVCKENACLRAKLAGPEGTERGPALSQSVERDRRGTFDSQIPPATDSSITTISETTAARPVPQRVSRRIYCDQCEKSFSRNADLKRHRLSVHEKRRFTCPDCGHHFSRQDVLSDHKRLGHCK